MCLLSYYPPGKQPDTARLQRGARINRDGFGWAVITPRNTLLTGRGLNAEETIGRFEAARKRNPGGPAMFHSRFATSGARLSVANCHPFTVAGDKRTVVAHNGVIFTMPQGETRSDTRYFAEDYMRPAGFTRFDKPAVRAALERWLGGGNKLVVLTVNPRYKCSAYIFNEHEGDWDDGEWHSNSGYKPCTWLSRPAWAPSAAEDDTAWAGWSGTMRTGADCVICEQKGTVAWGFCDECEGCQDCGEGIEDCQCWVPRAERKAIEAAKAGKG